MHRLVGVLNGGWLDGLRQELVRPFWVRVQIGLGALVVALLLAIGPISWAPYTSLTELVMGMLAAPAAHHLTVLKPGDDVQLRLQVALLLAFVLAQPTLLWLILDGLAPATVLHRDRRLHVAVLVAIVAFLAGLAWVY